MHSKFDFRILKYCIENIIQRTLDNKKQNVICYDHDLKLIGKCRDCGAEQMPRRIHEKLERADLTHLC